MSKRLDYNRIAPADIQSLGGVYNYAMQSGLPAELMEIVFCGFRRLITAHFA